MNLILTSFHVLYRMPLTPEQIAIVKSTVPILETGGETLTKHFYKTMFAEYDVVHPLFNQAHQVSGDQPRALANAVLAYAKNIDNLTGGLGPLGDVPAQIIHKHCGLNVLPEHYPIVGTCLLRAIREVLGAEVATDAVIDAWGAAYQQLADILIGAEKATYDEMASRPGGWYGKRPFFIHKKVVESEEVTSFYLKSVDGAAIVDFQPGQFIGVALIINGKEHRRNYSLSDAPNGQYYRLSIKKENGGVVSNHMHNQMKELDKIDLFPPFGFFTLKKDEKPLVLISGGVGLTPVMSMLNATLADKATQNRPITYIHFARNHKVHAFHSHLSDLAAKHSNLTYYYVYDEDLEGSTQKPHAIGRPTVELLEKWLPASKDIDVYFLGPPPFMATIKHFLKHLQIPESQSHFEFFGPAKALQELTCPFAGKASEVPVGAKCPFSGSK